MKFYKTAALGILTFLVNTAFGQNPIIMNQFTADPAARVFGDRVYLYPSHDILAREGKGRVGWFCMEDYHVFSSASLTNWVDHGVILGQKDVKWADSTTYSMWAPDCIYKNKRFYFFFPAIAKDTSYGRGFSIGVSVSEKPAGPFINQKGPIRNVHGIDPCIFIDKDGQVYLYYALGKIYVAKLKDNMQELASKPEVIEGLPDKGLIEGPFMFERNGIYYLTYPHVSNTIERLEYAIADSPVGPFQYKGILMDESPMGCWTNQQSIINFRNQWYIFYHQNDLSPRFDKNRAVSIDSLSFNADGTIKKVIPTFRGVGLTDASKQIQTDRYSLISEKGASVAFIDTLNTFLGWKTVFSSRNAWIQYNSVDFRKGPYKTLKIRVSAKEGGTLALHIDNIKGPAVARTNISKGTIWKEVSVSLSKISSGIHNIILQSEHDGEIETDWVKFTK
jgi:hypothetical protein